MPSSSAQTGWLNTRSPRGAAEILIERNADVIARCAELRDLRPRCPVSVLWEANTTESAFPIDETQLRFFVLVFWGLFFKTVLPNFR